MKKKKETQWYILWFYTAVIWLVNFIARVSGGRKPDFFTWLQLVNAGLSLGAGIVNRKRYLEKQDDE